MNSRLPGATVLAIFTGLMNGCIPQFIPPNHSQITSTSELKVTPQVQSDRPTQKIPQNTTIYPIDSQTFNLLIPNEDVWNATIDVLMRNYNLTILDKQNGVITTEWDSFYLDNQVFRNKVSLRITPHNYRYSKLLIINNIETLKEDAATGSLGATWVPCQDVAGESARIIKSIAAVLRQAPPVIPPGMLSQADSKQANFGQSN